MKRQWVLLEISKEELEILRHLTEVERDRMLHDPEGTDEEVERMYEIGKTLTRTIDHSGWSK